MLPGRKGAVVGLTSWKHRCLLTIYRYLQHQGGSQVSHSFVIKRPAFLLLDAGMDDVDADAV
jgi:hypothetical protein